jgi:type VI secretion system protein ImpA
MATAKKPMTQAGAKAAEKAAAPTSAAPTSAALCGESLEYDQGYASLGAQLQPKGEVQYGSFSTKGEGPDWSEIERQARALLSKSMDITVLIWLTRARTQLSGAAGLSQSLVHLAQQLEAHPVHIHPQIQVEGQTDPQVRANALAALADPEGLIADMQGIVVSNNSVTGLSLQDVARAHAKPRPAGSKEPQHVKAQLVDMAKQQHPVLIQLQTAAAAARRVSAWCAGPHSGLVQEQGEDKTGEDYTPNLSLLHSMLSPFEEAGKTEAGKQEPSKQEPGKQEPGKQEPAKQEPGGGALHEAAFLADSQAASASPAGPAGHTSQGLPGTAPLQNPHSPQSRAQAAALIAQAQAWFEQHEPSSPVGLMLKQAHRMVGMRFAQLAAAIPPDLLAQWDSQDAQS